jgi:carbonic anhydrase
MMLAAYSRRNFNFDFSMQGRNWQLDTQVIKDPQQQSPIDIPKLELVQYDPKYKLNLNYKDLSGVKVEKIGWSVRVRNLINALRFLIKLCS